MKGCDVIFTRYYAPPTIAFCFILTAKQPSVTSIEMLPRGCATYVVLYDRCTTISSASGLPHGRYLKEMGCRDVEWIQPAKNIVKCRVILDILTKIVF